MPTINPHTQIKITVSKRMYDQIQARADELGTTKANYLRCLAIDDLKLEPEKRLAVASKVTVVEMDGRQLERLDKRVDRGEQGRIKLQQLLDMM